MASGKFQRLGGFRLVSEAWWLQACLRGLLASGLFQRLGGFRQVSVASFIVDGFRQVSEASFRVDGFRQVSERRVLELMASGRFQRGEFSCVRL